MELVNGHESFLALCTRGVLSILGAGFKLAWASSLVAGEPWSTVRMEQRVFGEFYVCSEAIGVCAGLMSASVRMRQKKGSRSPSVRDVLSWPRKSAVSPSGQRPREVPGPSVPGRQRSVPCRFLRLP